MSKPMVSVVIPTYNRAHCINEAIDSVLAQSFDNYEMVVVDDGSSDSTAEVLRSYESFAKVLRQTNGGVSAARNTGIRASIGEWIAFLDSDDTWEPDKLKTQVEDLRSNRTAVAHAVDALIGNPLARSISVFDLRGVREEFKERPFRQRPLWDVLKTQFPTQCCMVRKDVIEKIGYFDTAMNVYEDSDFMARLALEGPFVVNCYQGVNIRRIAGGPSPLSDLHKTERVQALQNLVCTYTRLKRDPRLTSEELQRVCRSLSGVECEIALQYWRRKQWSSAVDSFRQSVANDPGLRSLARALLGATGADGLINWCFASRRKEGSFRRSELNGSSR